MYPGADSLPFSMYHKNVFLDCNYFFLFDKTNYLEFKGMGVKHIWHLPLAVDTNRLDELFAQDTMDKMQLAETDSECLKTFGGILQANFLRRKSV